MSGLAGLSASGTDKVWLVYMLQNVRHNLSSRHELKYNKVKISSMVSEGSSYSPVTIQIKYTIMHAQLSTTYMHV